ncbi:MAG: nitroreductase family protein [Clostridiales bacterium]|jgi:nitroreductase|nr:nitroreductase family protein [Clostridiales bacterium]
MNQVIDTMVKRRTIRKFKADQISDEELNAILEAGLHAPNAGGGQSSIIVVSQNAELNERLGKLSRNAENITGARMGRVSSEQPSIIDDESIKSAFYGAPTVLTIFAKPGYNLTGDCFAAAENIVVAAWSLGIGAYIVGRCAKTFSTEEGAKIQEMWGLDGEFEARVHVVLGYPDGKEPSYKPRKDGRVIFSK